MATTYKIHPAIGIARVGNSPDEFFIGPERIGEYPEPTGGFKDAQCRVKRQAARFRIFAHNDDGSVEEITDAEADISWTVHLVNKKAANPGRGNSESSANLTIDPGSRTLTGPDQRELFDDGSIDFDGASAVTVPLGEIRSDDENHLLVLGGFGTSASPGGHGIGSFWGNSGWYDDVSDGPVTAAIKIRATNATPAVVGAWVIVAPPKFAPHQDSVITLYDRILQAMIEAGLAAAPTTTSYTRDVYPILQRARDTKWVQSVGSAHSWTDPVTSAASRQAIFNRLTAPSDAGTDMPDLLESTPDGRLTPTQYAHMERWKDDNYANDWVGVPAAEAAISPDGMDRAALEACVGGAFYPGIEAGGRTASERPILDTGNYVEALRLDHAALSAGDITYTMALPWQADFNACADNWWPVPRPNDVLPLGGGASLRWDRDVGGYEDMVEQWHSLGFVVRQSAERVEVDRCDTASITLLTPQLNFQDVPQGPLGMVREAALAIAFEVIAPSGAVTLEYASGGAPTHAQLFAYNNSVTVGPTAADAVATARLWIVFSTSSAVGAIPTQTLVVQDAASGQQWTVLVNGNTVARKTAAAALVLDRSGSMSEDRGDGETKHVSLQQAASIFVDVMLEGDGVGLVRYNQDAQVLQDVLTLGAGGLTDVNRSSTKDLINGNELDPTGSTSIGDGIFEGRGILNATATPYDVMSLVVLTDGKENSSRYIADVSAEINEQTYSIGFGTPENTSAAALQTISGNHGGFLLITGSIGVDNRFLLQKYFLQILAGISNAEIVLDPDGALVPGQVQRIPFHLTRGDAGVDVILLTPYPRVVDFRLQTPTGQILEPWRAASEPSMRYVLSSGVSYYRLMLPAEMTTGRLDHGGTWHALLRIGKPRVERTRDSESGIDASILRGMFARPVRQHSSQRRVAHAERGALLATHAAMATQPTGSGHSSVSARSHSQATLPYSLIVHAWSNVSLHAWAQQSGYAPGSQVNLMATLAQSGVPMTPGSQVRVELERPDRSSTTLPMLEEEAGRFAASFTASLAGVYRIRVLARGRTRRGELFTRERALSAAVWLGGDRDASASGEGSDSRPGDSQLCQLVQCFLSRDGVIDARLEKRLHELGFDLNQIRRCLAKLCQKRAVDPTRDV